MLKHGADVFASDDPFSKRFFDFLGLRSFKEELKRNVSWIDVRLGQEIEEPDCEAQYF